MPCLVAVEVRHLRACQTPQNGRGQTGEEGIIVEGRRRYVVLIGCLEDRATHLAHQVFHGLAQVVPVSHQPEASLLEAFVGGPLLTPLYRNVYDRDQLRRRQLRKVHAVCPRPSKYDVLPAALEQLVVPGELHLRLESPIQVGVLRRRVCPRFLQLAHDHLDIHGSLHGLARGAEPSCHLLHLQPLVVGVQGKGPQRQWSGPAPCASPWPSVAAAQKRPRGRGAPPSRSRRAKQPPRRAPPHPKPRVCQNHPQSPEQSSAPLPRCAGGPRAACGRARGRSARASPHGGPGTPP